MKTAFKFLALSILGFMMASCCGVNDGYTTKTKKVTTYKEVVRTINPGTKGGMPYTKVERIPVVSYEKVKVKCVCGDNFCPEPECCGVISKQVLSRATVQGGTGEPHIGLIPTMKPLVPQAN